MRSTTTHAFMQLRDGMRKHYVREVKRKIKSVHQDDGRQFFISKQTRPHDKITASLFGTFLPTCIVLLALFFLLLFRLETEKNLNFMQMTSSLIHRQKAERKFLHSELWYLFMATSNNIIVRHDNKKKLPWELNLLFMTFVLTFSSGMFYFIAVVSCRRCGSNQVSDVRRSGKAARERRPSGLGVGTSRTTHSCTAPAYHSRLFDSNLFKWVKRL
jgi:hypothetical protein